jgi:hypothetical protein
MKASELIKKLQEEITRHGDLDCYVMVEHESTTMDNIGYTRLEIVDYVELSDIDKYGEEIYTNYQTVAKTVFKVG